MTKLLAFTAAAEAATGLALLLVPALVGKLLLGVELTGVSIPVAHLAGIGLFSLGVACWPGKEPARFAFHAMLIYNLLVAVYLAYLGIRGEWAGILLWPAVLLHTVLTLLLASNCFRTAAARQGRATERAAMFDSSRSEPR